MRHALETARRLGLNKVELEEGGEAFSALLGWVDPEDLEEAPPVDSAPLARPLTAPVVGYFRPLVQWREGTEVAGGKAIGEIVALGLANDIVSPLSGRLAALAVQDGDAVEFGQVLAQVEAKP
jgi:biotin carboxyl carrier protein